MDAKGELTEKQLHLMDAAEGLFAAKGFGSTSVRDIAQAAGVNLAMISYYFGSKDGLLEAIFSHRMRTVQVKFEDLIIRKDLTPPQKVDLLVDMYLDRMFAQTSFHKIVVQESAVLENTSLRALVIDYKSRNGELVRSLINQGVRSGDFRKGVDVQLLMMTLIGTANHALTGKSYYCEVNGLGSLSDDEYQALLKKKLSTHLKTLFKKFLQHEAD